MDDFKRERKKLNTILIIAGVFLSIVVAPTLISLLFSGSEIFANLRTYMAHVAFGFSYGVVFWLGNWAIGYQTGKRLNWTKNPNRANTISLLAFIFFGISASIAVPLFINKYLQHQVGRQLFNNTVFNAFIAFSVDMIVISVYYSRYLVFFWKESIAKSEKLERENLLAQYEALKNQVNPHFLFNSLNTLAGLVEQDPKKAVEFINHLSNTYRYVLEQRNKELVTIEEELIFVNDFIFLAKLRYGNGLIVNTQLSKKKHFIVPMAVQMLIENCIKHNIIDDEQPLVIDLFEEGPYLLVKNNLQKKSSVSGNERIGLQNLKSRYAFVSSLPVIIKETQDEFVVKIPLVTEAGQ